MTIFRRKRRSTAEVREAILNAAMKHFLHVGYERTGTKTVAATAGVQEPLIFRHFGSKAQLLEQTVLFSLQTFVCEFAQELDHGATPLEQNVTRYTQRLYALLSKERELIIALFAASSGRGARHRKVHSTLAPLFDTLTTMSKRHYKRGGVDPWFAVRLTFALVVATIVLEDWLLPSERTSKKGRLPAALVQYVVGGTLHRSPARVRSAARAASKTRSQRPDTQPSRKSVRLCSR